MKYLQLFLFIFFFVSAIGATDTLRVESAQMWEPVRTFSPYRVSDKNLKGEILEDYDALAKNALMHGQATRQIAYGEEMPSERGTLSQYAFRVRASRYAKVQIKVEGVGHYKLYDEAEHELTNGSLTLLNNEQRVRMLVQANKESKDSFCVSVLVDSIYSGSITVNDTHLRPYSLDDMNLGRQYGTPRLSPSGRYLLQAYYSTKRDGQFDQWAVLTDLRTNTTMQRMEGGLAYKWLEKSDILYYSRTRDNKTQLVTLNPATLEERVLSEDIPSQYFTLSPKQDYLIYSVSEDGRSANGAMKYLEEPDDRQPGWRTRWTLWKMDLNSGVRQRLTFGNETISLADISYSGDKLLLTYSTFDATKRPFTRTSVLEMDAYTGKVDTLLCDETFLTGNCTYLPGDRRILLTGTCNAFNNVGSELPDGKIGNGFHYSLFVYDRDSKKAEYILPPMFKMSVQSVTVCPGDNAVYLSGEDGYDKSLYRLDLRTLNARKINIPISYISRLSIATLQKNPTIVANGQHFGMEARRCVIGSSTGKFVPFGEIRPEDVNKGISMSECTEWEFQASRGDTIKCFYYDNGVRSDSKPMIVYYYGGCSPTPRIAEMLYPFQVWAAQGYTVLVVEPSGASGFGQEFGSRHVGTWGEGSADDIIEATTQFCKEHGWVDKSKIGCIGASYGGFMTQYLQTRTDIFAAAISHAGISNIASYWGGGYWGYSYGEVAEYGQFPWSDRELFVEHSPLFNAEKIHTPLLLLHGTVDTNVPTNESQQLYTALKILGREVAYVTIDGENHVVADFNKKCEWAHTIQAWFAKWLKNQPEWWNELYPASKEL